MPHGEEDFESIDLGLDSLEAKDIKAVELYVERVRQGLELILRLMPDCAALYVSRVLLAFALQVYLQLVPDGSRRAWLHSCSEAWTLELARDKTARRKSSTPPTPPTPPAKGGMWN